MADARGTVEGTHAQHKVEFYGLSTCIWCKRTRELLEAEGIQFDFVYVDLLEGEERSAALETLKRWNPSRNFPTLVIDDATPVVGYKPDKLKEILGV